MGDPHKQIDNPLCTPTFNGLTHAVNHFLPEPFSAVFPLTHLHRSQVAEVAANFSAYQ